MIGGARWLVDRTRRLLVVSSGADGFVSELLTVESGRRVAAAVWFVMCGRCNW